MKFICTRSFPQRLRRVGCVRVRNATQKLRSGRLPCVRITGAYVSPLLQDLASVFSYCFRLRFARPKNNVYAVFVPVFLARAWLSSVFMPLVISLLSFTESLSQRRSQARLVG